MATCRVAIAGPATMAHNWAVFHFGAGPALAEHDGAVMSASADPAVGRRDMLTGQPYSQYKHSLTFRVRCHTHLQCIRL